MRDWDSVARRYVERSTLPEQTFGEMAGVPRYGANGRLVGPRGDTGHSGPMGTYDTGASAGGYVRTTSPALPGTEVANRSSGGFVAHNDDALATSLHTGILAPIRDLPGFVYIGSPYSLYAGGYDKAARVVSTYAAALMASGLRVYSPIAHGHFVSGHGKLPLSWEFWKDQCQPMIDAASSLVVLTMDGWRESVGLTYEIGQFAGAGKPIVYLAPVAAVEGRAAA